MNETKLQKTGKGYSVATIGDLNSFKGKVFVKNVLGLTSMEVSFGTMPENTAVPFFHKHKQNEEVYIILGGKGVFTLDGEDIEVEAGSIVCVAPEVSRCNRNTVKEPFTYICIQAKAQSLEQAVADDAIIEQ